MDINILNLINAERNTDIELLEDMDNKISAVDYFNCLSDSLDEFDERAWNKSIPFFVKLASYFT